MKTQYKRSEESAPIPPCSYEPIRTWGELMNYGQVGCDMITRPCPQKTVPLSNAFSQFKVSLNGARYETDSLPKLLVCHDFCGGYGEDR